MPGGRPSEFRQEYVQQVAEMAERGATDTEIADALDVSVRSLYRWKAIYPQFSQVLKIAKDVADQRVEQSLYHRALGFERDAVKIFCSKDGEVTTVPYREQVAPDTTACIFWLKNRKREEWRDKVDHELTGKDGEPIQSAVTVTFVKTNASDQG